MWVPQDRSGAVLVVIFAGNFTNRSPSSDSNNGSILSLKSRAIVVNVNYHLGKCVYENIENFNRKRDMIKIFATIVNFRATVSPKTAQENMEDIAKLLKCNWNDDEQIKCLQTVDANKLFMASVTLHNSKLKTSKDSFLPINSDNVFFKESVDDKPKKKQMKNDFDLLFERDSDEGTYFMVKYLKKIGCNFAPNKHPECKNNSCRLNDTTLKDAEKILSNMVEFNQNETAELFMIYNSIKTNKIKKKSCTIFF
uniref:COesterase domain-containing protein n=1 Tax=Strongyloides venezuelensis TaxID=75913 RepID=A0A0K0FBT6_STRVS